MGIKQKFIDLTNDHKFTEITNNGHISDFLFAIRPSDSLPWKRMNDKCLRGDIRLYGDYISDNIGYTIRSTFSGHWFVTNENTNLDRKTQYLMLQQFLEEECAVSQDSTYYCPKCGKRMITKNYFLVCDKCLFDNWVQNTMEKLYPHKKSSVHNRDNSVYVPWRDYRTTQTINKITNQMETIIVEGER